MNIRRDHQVEIPLNTNSTNCEWARGQEILILRTAEEEKRGYHPKKQEKRPEEDVKGRPSQPLGSAGCRPCPHGGCRRAWDASTAAPSPLPGVKSCADVLLLLNVTFTRYLRVRGNLHKTRVNASFLSPLLTLHSKAPKTDLLLQPALRLPPLREAFKLLTVSLTALW